MSYRQADKTNSSPEAAQTHSRGSAQFADTRTSTAAQLQLQTRMYNSPQTTAQRVMQQHMNNSHIAQKKTLQRVQDEELLQGKFATAQRAEDVDLRQGKFIASPPTQLAEKSNNTGLPNQLKAGIESLSGISLDQVKVHYNSDKPAQLNAHAYAQGSDIHVAPGQEQHLPHEAWHVVQQAQGRVKPTMQMKGDVPVNDDAGLETEADVMGAKALTLSSSAIQNDPQSMAISPASIQRKVTMAEVTADKHYGIGSDTKSTLYGIATATAPEPTGLYSRKAETTSGKVDGKPAEIAVSGWTPNVKFLQGSVIDDDKQASWTTRTFSSAAKAETEATTNTLTALKSEIEKVRPQVMAALRTDDSPDGATMGIIGKNDCAAWADRLRHLIIAARGVDSAPVRTAFDLGSEEDPSGPGPAVGVGSQMDHKLNGSNSNYHGATVVAQDGASLVTLEAHVEKAIDTPEFHIRQGLVGFIESNNEGATYREENGRTGSVTTGATTPDPNEGVLTYYESQLGGTEEEQIDALRGLMRSYQKFV